MSNSPIRLVTITIPNVPELPSAVRDFIERSYYHAEPQSGIFAIGSSQSDAEISAALLAHLPPEASVSIHAMRGMESRQGHRDIGFTPDFDLKPPKDN